MAYGEQWNTCHVSIELFSKINRSPTLVDRLDKRMDNERGAELRLSREHLVPQSFREHASTTHGCTPLPQPSGESREESPILVLIRGACRIF